MSPAPAPRFKAFNAERIVLMVDAVARGLVPSLHRPHRRDATPPMTDTQSARSRLVVRPTRTPVRLAASGLVLAVALAAGGCGNGSTSDDSPGQASSDADPSAPSTARERITEGGVAALVSDHLGKSAVVSFGTYGEDRGEVGLMVRLRGGNPADMFAVSAYSPKQGGREFAFMAKCPTPRQRKRSGGMKEFTCHRLPNGTTVTAYMVPSGFSDDNARGLVITGVAVARDKSTSMVMYESYDKTTPISVADVDELLSDPRMTWMTDPEINRAGESLEIKKLQG